MSSSMSLPVTVRGRPRQPRPFEDSSASLQQSRLDGFSASQSLATGIAPNADAARQEHEEVEEEEKLPEVTHFPEVFGNRALSQDLLALDFSDVTQEIGANQPSDSVDIDQNDVLTNLELFEYGDNGDEDSDDDEPDSEDENMPDVDGERNGNGEHTDYMPSIIIDRCRELFRLVTTSDKTTIDWIQTYNYYFDPPPLSRSRISQYGAKDFLMKRIFLWCPELRHGTTSWQYRCPDCRHSLSIKGFNTTYPARRVIGHDSIIFLCGRRLLCTSCKKTFMNTDRAVLDLLPAYIASEFTSEFYLTRKTAVTFDVKEELLASINRVPDFHRALTRRHHARYFQVYRRFLELAKAQQHDLGGQSTLSDEARMFPEGFENKNGYSGFIPQPRFFRRLINDLFFSDRLAKICEQFASVPVGSHLKVDKTYRVTQRLRLNGRRIFAALYTIMNEFSQVVAHVLVNTESDNEIKPCLDEFVGRWRAQGCPLIMGFHTDQCCRDRSPLLESLASPMSELMKHMRASTAKLACANGVLDAFDCMRDDYALRVGVWQEFDDLLPDLDFSENVRCSLTGFGSPLLFISILLPSVLFPTSEPKPVVLLLDLRDRENNYVPAKFRQLLTEPNVQFFGIGIEETVAWLLNGNQAIAPTSAEFCDVVDALRAKYLNELQTGEPLHLLALVERILLRRVPGEADWIPRQAHEEICSITAEFEDEVIKRAAAMEALVDIAKRETIYTQGSYVEIQTPAQAGRKPWRLGRIINDFSIGDKNVRISEQGKLLELPPDQLMLTQPSYPLEGDINLAMGRVQVVVPQSSLWPRELSTYTTRKRAPNWSRAILMSLNCPIDAQLTASGFTRGTPGRIRFTAATSSAQSNAADALDSAIFRELSREQAPTQLTLAKVAEYMRIGIVHLGARFLDGPERRVIHMRAFYRPHDFVSRPIAVLFLVFQHADLDEMDAIVPTAACSHRVWTSLLARLVDGAEAGPLTADAAGPVPSWTSSIDADYVDPVQKDLFHVLHHLNVPLKTGLGSGFLRATSFAIQKPNAEDYDKAWNARQGEMSEERFRVLLGQGKFYDTVRRRSGKPAEIANDLLTVKERYQSTPQGREFLQSHNGQLLKRYENTIAHAKKGCLSDPVAFEDMYVAIPGKFDKYGLQRYWCKRGTSQLERYHRHLNEFLDNMPHYNLATLLAGLSAARHRYNVRQQFRKQRVRGAGSEALFEDVWEFDTIKDLFFDRYGYDGALTWHMPPPQVSAPSSLLGPLPEHEALRGLREFNWDDPDIAPGLKQRLKMVQESETLRHLRDHRKFEDGSILPLPLLPIVYADEMAEFDALVNRHFGTAPLPQLLNMADAERLTHKFHQQVLKSNKQLFPKLPSYLIRYHAEHMRRSKIRSAEASIATVTSELRAQAAKPSSERDVVLLTALLDMTAAETADPDQHVDYDFEMLDGLQEFEFGADSDSPYNDSGAMVAVDRTDSPYDGAGDITMIDEREADTGLAPAFHESDELDLSPQEVATFNASAILSSKVRKRRCMVCYTCGIRAALAKDCCGRGAAMACSLVKSQRVDIRAWNERFTGRERDRIRKYKWDEMPENERWELLALNSDAPASKRQRRQATTQPTSNMPASDHARPT